MANDLISRDKMLGDLYAEWLLCTPDTPTFINGELQRCEKAKLIEEGMKLVQNQPAVDAVEVVRCKDCKYWGGRHASNECSLITKLGNPDYWLKTLPTDYCSSGVKMDGKE